MPKIENVSVGQVLYTVRRELAGNTTTSRIAVHPVKVISVDPDSKWVFASWNGNEPRRFWDRHVRQWRVNKPESK